MSEWGDCENVLHRASHLATLDLDPWWSSVRGRQWDLLMDAHGWLVSDEWDLWGIAVNEWATLASSWCPALAVAA